MADFNFKKFWNKKSDIVDEPGKSSKAFGILKVAAIIVVILMVVRGGFYNVSEQENAVVTQFGRVIRTDTAGLYFKIPAQPA